MAACNMVGGPPHDWRPWGRPVAVKCERCGVEQNWQGAWDGFRAQLAEVTRERDGWKAREGAEREQRVAQSAELAEERSRLSHIAEALGLAPYGGAYNPERVLPAVTALRGVVEAATVASSWFGSGISPESNDGDRVRADLRRALLALARLDAAKGV